MRWIASASELNWREKNMQKVRCPNCGQTLFFARSADLEIKCQRCKQIVKVNIQGQSQSHQAE